MNLQNWKRLRVTAILLLTLSFQFLSSPSVWAVIGDKVEISPGKIPKDTKIPPTEMNHYLGDGTFMVKLEYPRSFILQETVGDLVFKLILKEPVNRTVIYVPPEFKVNLDTSYVWSSINNSYANVGVSKLSSLDRIAPNWYAVTVSNTGNATKKATIPPSSTHATNGTIWPGNHTVRLFNVTAPSVVGQYFFKVFTNGTSIGSKNFPSVVVSADPNPAYVSGTVRYGGKMPLQEYVYGNPINLSRASGEGGKVCATGITTEGRIVVGQAFFNASANYTLYGLAPGRYTLNATAAGYAPGELQYPILLKAGQSLEGVDIFLEHSPVTTVAALSRWMKQPAQWGSLRNGTDIAPQNKTITLEVFDIWNTTIRLLNSTTDNKTTSHTFEYRGDKDLDGHIPQENAGYVGGIGPGRYYFRVWVNGYAQPSAANEWVWRNECAVVFTRNEQNRRIDILLEKTGTLKVTVHFMNSAQMMLRESGALYNGRLIVEAYNVVEEMRARNFTLVFAGSTTASVELTGLFNSSRDYGLPPGEYIIFARLVPPTFLGALSHPYYVSVGGVYLPSVYRYGPTGHRVTIGEGRNEISLYVLLQGRLNFTVYSVTPQRPFSITAWKYPESAINVEIWVVRDGYVVEEYGSLILKKNEAVNRVVIGLDDGTYSIRVRTYGYVQEREVFFSVRRGEIADISAYVVTGGEIKITLVFQKQKILSSIDTYRDYWDSSEPKVPVRFEIYDSRMQFVGASATYIPNADTRVSFSTVNAGFKAYYGNNATRWINYYDTTDGKGQTDYGLGPDWYTLKVYVPGYHQKTDPVIEVKRGGETSVIILLERMAHLCGNVTTFNTYFGNYTRISWVNVDAIGEEMTIRSCTMDGFFEMWLVPGSYLVVFSLPGYQDRSVRLSMPEGSDVQVVFQLLPLGFKV